MRGGVDSEKGRIEEVYRKRGEALPKGIYSAFNPGHLFLLQRRERVLIELLRRYGVNHETISHHRILEVGCGTGWLLRKFVEYGAGPENLWGIDILEHRVTQAHTLSPNLMFVLGDARVLPFPDATFDLVAQFTLLTSVLDWSMKKRISSEMARVVKPDGLILWYDFHLSHPKNPDVKGIGKREIARLFPGFSCMLKKVTLFPPLARRLAPYAWWVCALLEQLPFLRTHYLGVITRRGHGK